MWLGFLLKGYDKDIRMRFLFLNRRGSNGKKCMNKNWDYKGKKFKRIVDWLIISGKWKEKIKDDFSFKFDCM